MLEEGKIVKLSDDEKYLIMLVMEINKEIYYYALRATGEDKKFLILKQLDGNNVEINTDEEIKQVFYLELLKQAK